MTLNYHTPEVNGMLVVRRGTAIEFSYSKAQNGFVLRAVEIKRF